MKKLLLGCIAAMGLSASASAQLALENFNYGGALPAGWTMINDGLTVSTSFTGLTWLQDSLNDHAWFPVHAAGATTDYQMISTSKFNPAATADRWLISPSFNVTSPNMVIQWQDYNLNSTESIQVLVSPTADTTAASFVSIYSAPASGGALTTHQVPIGAYNGTAITVAFRERQNNGWGMIIDNVQTTILPSIDLGVTSNTLPPFVQTGSSNTISGVLRNYGVTTVTSLDLNYTVNGGAPVVTALSGLSVALGSNYTYTSSTPWVPSAAGSYTLKIWADNINTGGVDGANANDTFTTTILVIDTLQPKMVMVEEFTNASCDPCANAQTNVDTVHANNAARATMVRYHVNFPGRDCMDSVTLAPFVSARMTYSNVTGVPNAQVDGKYVYPGSAGPGTFSTAVIGAAAAVGSPFTLSVTPGYNSTTDAYSFTADIKAHGPIPAGLKLYAVLAIDTLRYAANQSQQTIPQTIFPEVAEAMIPNSAGTTLTAFTSGSTQTITKSWTKNHRWGSSYNVWKYDSTCTGKIVIWIANDTKKYVYQAAQANVNTCKTVSVAAVTSSNGSMEVYPNPASQVATISMNLLTATTVKIEVYNTAGQIVYSLPAEDRIAGHSRMNIDLASFASGNYFVRATIGEEVLTQKLTVAK